jgi:hypothetical protein
VAGIARRLAAMLLHDRADGLGLLAVLVSWKRLRRRAAARPAACRECSRGSTPRESPAPCGWRTTWTAARRPSEQPPAILIGQRHAAELIAATFGMP